jgi:two-component system LytT family response regulator
MTKSINALIVDDEELGRKIIREYLQLHPEIRIAAECQDAHEALEAVEMHHPELIFLDIQMPEINGFEFLDMLDEIPHVIFSTAYDQYALQAFEVNAVDYLLKPYVQSRFDMAVERVINKIREGKPEQDKIVKLLDSLRPDEPRLERFLVKQSGRIVIVPVSEILWIEALEDYVNLHTDQEIYLVQQSMHKMEIRLDPKRFVRVHRSFIVNLEGVQELVPWTNGRLKCRLKSGEELILSRAGSKKIKELSI